MTNDDTIFARPEEQHTNPDNFADLVSTIYSGIIMTITVIVAIAL